MILLDDRANSNAAGDKAALYQVYLSLCRLGCDVSLDRLEFGDIVFGGNGPDSKGYTIAIEHKTISEILTCIESDRFTGHQLPGMREDYDFCYLLVEGLWLEGDDGELLIRKGKDYLPPKGSGRAWTFEGVWAWLQTIQNIGGLSLLLTANSNGSARVVRAVSRWWAKEWDSHNSLNSLYAPGRPATVSPGEQVTQHRIMVAQIPGVGWKLSQRALDKFGSIANLVNAKEAEWAELEKVGPKKASGITRFLQEPQVSKA